MKYVIIGGGIAGTTAAEELRRADADAEITIIEQEEHPLYSKVLLPHYVLGKVEREKCFLKDEEWYEQNKIELMLGTRVTKLDTKNKFVETDTAREVPYDKLLITTGTEPRVIGGEPRGTCYFWTFDDTEHLLHILSEQDSGSSAVVYGGGFIACEFINIFANQGLPTTVVLRGKHFWNSILNDQVGEFFTKHLENNGVKVLSNTKFKETVGDLELLGVKTDQGTIDCSIMGAAIGQQTDLGWIKDAGIKIGRGVLTNEYLETNTEDVFAAGDIAESYDPIAERQYLAGNWGRALMQGRTVAKNMLGKQTAYQQVSSYAINVLGLDVSFIGDTSKEAADEVIVRGDEAEGMTQILIRDNKVVGAAILGRNGDRGPLTRMIQNQESADSLE
ncbi:MAG: FAD-dependent oxidoreductase [Candidatus Uhrbacteria bacterium]